MARIKMHIPKAKLPFYPPCEVKCRLQNEVSTQAKQVSQQSNKSSVFLSAHVPVAFKIIVKLDYLER